MTDLATTPRSLALDDNTWQCDRCGAIIESRYKPVHGRCKDCRETLRELRAPRDRARYVIDGVAMLCRPWTGDFDDDDNPLKGGLPYRPGRRTCGHRDCVNTEHIVDDV